MNESENATEVCIVDDREVATVTTIYLSTKAKNEWSLHREIFASNVFIDLHSS